MPRCPGRGGDFVAQLVRQPLVVEVAEPVRDDDRGGLGVDRQVAQLGAAVRGQRHHRDDAGPQAGEGEHDEFPPVRQLHDDAVVRCEAEVEQPPCGGVGPSGQLAVGQPHGSSLRPLPELVGVITRRPGMHRI